MDMGLCDVLLAIDITELQDVDVGAQVELWSASMSKKFCE